MSASWFLVSTFLIWDSVEQPIKRNSVGSSHVSYCWTSSFDNHLDHSFIIFKDVQLRLALRRVCWWVRNPHMTIAPPLAFSFQLVLWLRFY